MSADEKDVHQAVDQPVVTVYKAVGVTVFVNAAGPEPAPCIGVWLNTGGNLL